MATIHLNKAEFEKRVAKLSGGWKFLGDKPALVDFYASWCRPCQMLSPIIDELAEEYAGRVDIYKVSVDDEQEVAAHFNVRSIPTLAYIRLSDRPTLVPGGMGKAQLKIRSLSSKDGQQRYEITNISGNIALNLKFNLVNPENGEIILDGIPIE